MAARLRRRAPIFAGGRSTLGASVSSPGYMGSVAATLTNTLHQMQFYEQLKNLEKGDPSHFLAVMKPMLGNISKDDPMYAVVKEYVDKAEKYAVTSKADTDAYSAWVKSGNNIAYRDYLQKRADAEQDQTARMGILKDVATLDKRINTGSGGIGNSGITSDDYRKARDDYRDIVNRIGGKTASGDSISQADLDDYARIGKTYSDVLTKIEQSNVSRTTSDKAAADRDNGSGPQSKWIDGQTKVSDENAVKAFEGNSANMTMAKVEADQSPGALAKNWALRAQQLMRLGQTALSPDGRNKAGVLLDKAEKTSTMNLDKAVATSKKLPPGADEDVRALYNHYVEQFNAKSQGRKQPASESKFREALATATNANEFQKVVGLQGTALFDPAHPEDFNTYKGEAGAFGPASYDPEKSTFVGAPEQVRAAQDAVDTVRFLRAIPGNDFSGITGHSHDDVSTEDLFHIAKNDVIPGTEQGTNAKGEPIQMAGTTYRDALRDLGGGAGSTIGESRPSQSSLTPENISDLQQSQPGAPRSEVPTGTRVGMSRPMESGYSDEDWTQTMESADASLTAYKAPDLGEAPPPIQADESSLFSSAPDRFDTGQNPMAV